MDRNKDGVVTIEEFIESCKKVTYMMSLNILLYLEQDSESLQVNEHYNWIMISLLFL